MAACFIHVVLSNVKTGSDGKKAYVESTIPMRFEMEFASASGRTPPRLSAILEMQRITWFIMLTVEVPRNMLYLQVIDSLIIFDWAIYPKKERCCENHIFIGQKLQISKVVDFTLLKKKICNKSIINKPNMYKLVSSLAWDEWLDYTTMRVWCIKNLWKRIEI